MLLRTELEGRTHLITLIRLLLSDYYYPGCDWNPDPKIRPVVHEKQLSGSQIRISIRITPNFELRLPMIITSLLTKFRQNPTSNLWEILLTNKQTNRQTDTRRWLQYPAFRGIKTTKNFPSQQKVRSRCPCHWVENSSQKINQIFSRKIRVYVHSFNFHQKNFVQCFLFSRWKTI